MVPRGTFKPKNMNGFLNIIPESNEFQFEKSLNFDNWRLYLLKSYGKHIHFKYDFGFAPVLTSFKLIDYITSDEYVMNTNLITIVNNSMFFNSNDVLPASNISTYYYSIETAEYQFKSELFHNYGTVTYSETNNWFTSRSILKIKISTDLWSFQNSLNFDNKNLYKHFSKETLLPFFFEVGSFDVGAIVSFKIINYNTLEETTLSTSLIQGAYYFSGSFSQYLENGCYYYKIQFANKTFESEIWVNKNEFDYETFFIVDENNNILVDESNNYITYQ